MVQVQSGSIQSGSAQSESGLVKQISISGNNSVSINSSGDIERSLGNSLDIGSSLSGSGSSSGSSDTSSEGECLGRKDLGLDSGFNLSINGDFLDNGGWNIDSSHGFFLADHGSVMMVGFGVVDSVLDDGLGDNLLGGHADDFCAGLGAVDCGEDVVLSVCSCGGETVELDDVVNVAEGGSDCGVVLDTTGRGVEDFGCVFAVDNWLEVLSALVDVLVGGSDDIDSFFDFFDSRDDFCVVLDFLGGGVESSDSLSCAGLDGLDDLVESDCSGLASLDIDELVVCVLGGLDDCLLEDLFPGDVDGDLFAVGFVLDGGVEVDRGFDQFALGDLSADDWLLDNLSLDDGLGDEFLTLVVFLRLTMGWRF